MRRNEAPKDSAHLCEQPFSRPSATRASKYDKYDGFLRSPANMAKTCLSSGGKIIRRMRAFANPYTKAHHRKQRQNTATLSRHVETKYDDLYSLVCSVAVGVFKTYMF